MRQLAVSLALAACLLRSTALAAPPALEQQPLQMTAASSDSDAAEPSHTRKKPSPRPLKGRFLHITDLHPDPFYRIGSNVADEACHRGHGGDAEAVAGFYGAAKSSCDSPLALVNATFAWIDAHLKDEIDFVVWTGDSARHDNDEMIPRDREQVTRLNDFAVGKFREVFGKDEGDDDDPVNDMTVPIVPTLGNNDILPHNVFFQGPNRWTRTYLNLWRPFIPEAQRHGFATGGWFFREVIPNHLAVFSINSLYFFDHNSAVDGCADRGEPGFQQFEWLRIQLQFLRRRGMKAILIGHVPPARTAGKQSWDETCWHKYTLWMRQYRDVVIGSIWGHMNIDHFMLQDNEDIDLTLFEGAHTAGTGRQSVMNTDGEMTVQSSTDYLEDLRNLWARLPQPPKGVDLDLETLKGKKKKKKLKKYLKKIGGKFAERYSLGLVSPSIVPNYYPTLRIISYNISELEHADRAAGPDTDRPAPVGGMDDVFEDHDSADDNASGGATRKNKKKHKHKKPPFKKPKGPSKSTPPGPAYSMQPLTWTGYQQLFANLTALEAEAAAEAAMDSNAVALTKKKPKKPPPFRFTLEYDTRNDSVYRLPDLTVHSYLRLAQRLGQYKAARPQAKRRLDDELTVAAGEKSTGIAARTNLVWRLCNEGAEAIDAAFRKLKNNKKHKKKKGKKGKKKERRNRPWVTFWTRAFVGAKDMDAEEAAAAQQRDESVDAGSMKDRSAAGSERQGNGEVQMEL